MVLCGHCCVSGELLDAHLVGVGGSADCGHIGIADCRISIVWHCFCWRNHRSVWIPLCVSVYGRLFNRHSLRELSLHRRFALNILAAAGGNPRRLIGGFMLATALLSMWISNTATTLMMLPIALSVIAKLNLKQHPNFAVALLLGTAYAANIGGMATLVGTPPNVALAGIMEEQYEVVIPFMEWMLLASPFSALLLLLVYVLFDACSPTNIERRNRIRDAAHSR